VVLGVEDERDSVTGGGIDTRGRVGKGTGGTDLDLEVCRRDSGGKGGEDDGGKGEMHFDYLLVFILDDPERVDDNLVGLCENCGGRE
jgi:hypothetical protein